MRLRLLVQACSLLNAKRLGELGVDGVIVGHRDYASRLPGDVTLHEIKELVSQGINVHVCVNNLFDESKLPMLEQYLVELAEIKPAFVVFHDYAVAQINEEKQLGLKLCYNSETMVTSYGQLPFFAQNKVASVALARELMLPEVVQIANKNSTNVALEVQVHGLMFVMQSKWNLLLNYKEYVEDKSLDISQHAQFMIREDTRKMGNFIYEDQNGTHMLTGYELCALEVLPQLAAARIDYVRIDSVMRDATWIEEAAAVYVQAIDLLEKGLLDEKRLATLKARLVANAKDVPTFLGFLGGPKTNPHFEREVE